MRHLAALAALISAVALAIFLTLPVIWLYVRTVTEFWFQ